MRDTDGTVVFTLDSIVTGGSRKTVEIAKKLRKPFVHIHPGLDSPRQPLVQFVHEHGIRVLNVAGSRESEEPGLYKWVMRILDRAFLPQKLMSVEELLELHERIPVELTEPEICAWLSDQTGNSAEEWAESRDFESMRR